MLESSHTNKQGFKMNQIDEYFSPTKLAELKTTVHLEIPPFVQGGGWEANSERSITSSKVRAAEQKLEVYSSREKLAQLSNMIEELNSIHDKVEAIQDFAKENGLADMVSFCCWSDTGSALDEIIGCDVEEDAIKWMHSNHNC